MKRKKRRGKRYNKPGMLIITCVVIFVLIGGIVGWINASGEKTPDDPEIRAVWLSYLDFKKAGLNDKDESQFRENAAAFLDRAEENHLNTIYFHVRAFDDAAYPSETFKISTSLWSKDSQIPYDPLKIMIELVHKKGMKIHGWMNPYRITMDYFLDPALDSSTERIVREVTEVMDYDIDGIHFDDYFYNAGKGYKDVTGKKTISVKKEPADEQKRKNVNKMVSTVYQAIKQQNKDAQFGISPQGNIENCRAIGADVDTWLSQDGYIDYIVPQLYWTDRHTAKWRPKMFTDTLAEWQSINKQSKPIYIGLALYRAGEKGGDDKGWKRSDSNLAQQLKTLRKAGCQGYSIFSARDLYGKHAQKERENLNEAVEGTK